MSTTEGSAAHGREQSLTCALPPSGDPPGRAVTRNSTQEPEVDAGDLNANDADLGTMEATLAATEREVDAALRSATATARELKRALGAARTGHVLRPAEVVDRRA